MIVEWICTRGPAENIAGSPFLSCSKSQQKSKANGLGNNKYAARKKLSRGSLSNLCDDDADISKTICQPPRYWGST